MIKKHLPLFIGISLPIIFIISMSIVIFAPSLFIKPQFNFLYTSTDIYSNNQTYNAVYEINNGRLELETNTAIPPLPSNQDFTQNAGPLYRYNVRTNSSHEVSFDEAKNYAIDPGPSSPDGYTVKYEYDNGGLFDLFGGNESFSGYFIGRGNGKKRLSGLKNTDQYRYRQDFRLIGWIK